MASGTGGTDERGPRHDRLGRRVSGKRTSGYRRAASVVALVLVLLLVAAAVGPTGVAAQSASISLSVDGQPVAAGDDHTVEKDPSVGVEVSADSTVESVILRVNGDTVETFEPNATTFSQTLDVELLDDDNEVTVIAETAAGVESQTITVTKDDRGPFIRFTSPFETDHHRDVIPTSVEVNDSYLVLSGEIHDASAVEHITITRRFQYYHANVQFQSNARWDVEDPSGTFEKRIFLGNGSNEISIRVEDELGYGRDYSILLNVTDEEEPEVDLDLPDETHGTTLELDGEVRDNGQLDKVSVEVEGVLASKGLFDGIDSKPDLSARSVPLSGTVPLRPGENTVVVTATDLAGNTVEVNQTVVYTRSVVPIVLLDRDETSVQPDGTIHVAGVVEDGEITGVTVETVAVDSGEIVDLSRVYAGPEATGEVTLDETLDLAEGETQVVVRYTDSNDDEHQTSFHADPATGAIEWEPSDAADDGEANATAEESEATGNESSAETTEAPEDGQESTPAPVTTVATGGLPLPGFTAATAVVALALVAVLSLVGRRRSR